MVPGEGTIVIYIYKWQPRRGVQVFQFFKNVLTKFDYKPYFNIGTNKDKPDVQIERKKLYIFFFTKNILFHHFSIF